MTDTTDITDITDASDTVDAHGSAPAPCAVALIAANVALMSAYANPAHSAGPDGPTQRARLARKVLSNLCVLREHPALPPALRQVMAQAHPHWLQVEATDRAAAAAPCTQAPCATLH